MARHKLFEKTKYFIIDMDGTFYLSNRLISGSADFVGGLKDKGLDFYFFTNNSSNNVQVCSDKLRSMGFPVNDDKIIISTHVTIDYLNKHHPGKSVYLLGNERLTADFEKGGINLVREDPDIVVLGFDTTLTYEKIRKAAKYISEGALYIATHPDLNCPTADGFKPDTGSMIELFAASTGKRPLIMGKPMTAAVDYITDLLGCERENLVFVGDRLMTDIAVGANHGIPCVLVMTGVTTPEEYERSSVKADLVVNSLSALSDYI
ncbi:MAG: HAD-IIA family hydrolase [Clostridiales bacterium]|nr:HAD-IIA family hydrolase [Clostridiales bacterium]